MNNCIWCCLSFSQAILGTNVLLFLKKETITQNESAYKTWYWTSFQFKIGVSGLEMVYNYKYFGVILNEKCDFSHTCDVLAKGAGIALGSIISKILDACKMSSAYSPSLPFSFIFHFVLYHKVSHLLHQNGVGEKEPFIYFELNWPQYVPTCE